VARDMTDLQFRNAIRYQGITYKSGIFFHTGHTTINDPWSPIAYPTVGNRRATLARLIDWRSATDPFRRTDNPANWSAYRDVGRPGEPYPRWLQDLKGKNGAYAIRQGDVLVYVGESHSDRLYETMTRHFQRWECTDERCNTYPRASVTVSVITTSAAEAPTVQAHAILERQPRDNIYETEETTDAIPF